MASQLYAEYKHRYPSFDGSKEYFGCACAGMAHVNNELPISDRDLDEWLFSYSIWDNGSERQVGYLGWRQTVEGKDAQVKFEQEFMIDEQNGDVEIGAGCVLTWEAVNELVREGGPHVQRTTQILDDAVTQWLMEESDKAALAASKDSKGSAKKEDGSETAVAPAVNASNIHPVPRATDDEDRDNGMGDGDGDGASSGEDGECTDLYP